MLGAYLHDGQALFDGFTVEIFDGFTVEVKRTGAFVLFVRSHKAGFLN